MAGIANNQLTSIISVFAYKTIDSFLADMPFRDVWTENFDDSIAQVGQVVYTRQPTTVFGSLNDLANGWESQAATASVYSATLKTLGHDHLVNVTDWRAIGEQQVLNIFGNVVAKQVANGITVNVLNNVTSSYFTNTITITSSSALTLTGSTGLQGIAKTLSNLEVPHKPRYCILNPDAYQGLISSPNVYQTLGYGNSSIIQNNGYTSVDGEKIEMSYQGLKIAGFDTYEYPRLGRLGSLPYGGDKVSQATLIGLAGHKSGLFVGARTPIQDNAPLYQSAVIVEPTSKFPLQYVMAFDPSKPGWRFGIYTMFGSSAASPNGIVPILTQSN